MDNLNELENDLVSQYKKAVDQFKERLSGCINEGSNAIANLKIAFSSSSGQKQSGPLYKFASVIKNGQNVKIEVWSPDNSQKIYKSLTDKNIYTDIKLIGNSILISLAPSTAEDRMKMTKAIDQHMNDLDNFLKAIKKKFETKVKKDFEKGSKDTLYALMQTSENNHKNFIKIVKTIAEDFKKKLKT